MATFSQPLEDHDLCWHNWTFRDVPAPVANQVESGPRELANVVLLFRRGIVGELANALKIPL